MNTFRSRSQCVRGNAGVSTLIVHGEIFDDELGDDVILEKLGNILMNLMIVDQFSLVLRPMDLIERVHEDATFQANLVRIVVVDEQDGRGQLLVGWREKSKVDFGCELNR